MSRVGRPETCWRCCQHLRPTAVNVRTVRLALSPARATLPFSAIFYGRWSVHQTLLAQDCALPAVRLASWQRTTSCFSTSQPIEVPPHLAHVFDWVWRAQKLTTRKATSTLRRRKQHVSFSMRWEMGGFFAYETKIQKHNSEGFKGIATHLHSKYDEQRQRSAWCPRVIVDGMWWWLLFAVVSRGVSGQCFQGVAFGQQAFSL